MSDRRGGEREQPPERRASEGGRERRDGGVRNVTQRSAHLHGNCVRTLADFSEEDLGERCWWRKGQETWVEGASLRSLSICHPSLSLSSGTRSTFLQNSEGCFFFWSVAVLLLCTLTLLVQVHHFLSASSCCC